MDEIKLDRQVLSYEQTVKTTPDNEHSYYIDYPKRFINRHTSKQIRNKITQNIGRKETNKQQKQTTETKK